MSEFTKGLAEIIAAEMKTKTRARAEGEAEVMKKLREILDEENERWDVNAGEEIALRVRGFVEEWEEKQG